MISGVVNYSIVISQGMCNGLGCSSKPRSVGSFWQRGHQKPPQIMLGSDEVTSTSIAGVDFAHVLCH
jgi:hypothetical protein